MRLSCPVGYSCFAFMVIPCSPAPRGSRFYGAEHCGASAGHPQWQLLANRRWPAELTHWRSCRRSVYLLSQTVTRHGTTAVTRGGSGMQWVRFILGCCVLSCSAFVLNAGPQSGTLI